jgi:A/G-specific adenine glycosylase
MHFSDILTNWYSKNKRDLPWRNTSSPYKVWLSEIILQQTRVAQGLDYYNKFVESYPTIVDLANDDEDNVLKLWQGLGYYSRARNLHATAKIVSFELNGVFPMTYDQIIRLKGVGPYTAAAISSFCFGEKKAVVDGNVYRVLSRYFGISTPTDSTIGKKEFQELAQECLSSENPGEHNQAIMEFGALQCTPNPNCEACPLRVSCIAYINCMVKAFPIKAKKIKVRDRYFNFIVISDNDSFYIQKRESKDIWQNLYQFPLKETKKEILSPFELEESIVSQAVFLQVSEQFKHLLSHQRIYAKFWEFNLAEMPTLKGFEKIKKRDIQEFAIPRLIEKYLESVKN